MSAGTVSLCILQRELVEHETMTMLSFVSQQQSTNKFTIPGRLCVEVTEGQHPAKWDACHHECIRTDTCNLVLNWSHTSCGIWMCRIEIHSEIAIVKTVKYRQHIYAHENFAQKFLQYYICTYSNGEATMTEKRTERQGMHCETSTKH